MVQLRPLMGMTFDVFTGFKRRKAPVEQPVNDTSQV